MWNERTLVPRGSFASGFETCICLLVFSRICLLLLLLLFAAVVCVYAQHCMQNQKLCSHNRLPLRKANIQFVCVCVFVHRY